MISANNDAVYVAVEAMCAAEGEWPLRGPMTEANEAAMAARRAANSKRLAAAFPALATTLSDLLGGLRRLQRERDAGLADAAVRSAYNELTEANWHREAGVLLSLASERDRLRETLVVLGLKVPEGGSADPPSPSSGGSAPCASA